VSIPSHCECRDCESLRKAFNEAIGVIEAYSACIRMLKRAEIGPEEIRSNLVNSADKWLETYTVRKLKQV
jgi:hypothetical protein